MLERADAPLATVGGFEDFGFSREVAFRAEGGAGSLGLDQLVQLGGQFARLDRSLIVTNPEDFLLPRNDPRLAYVISLYAKGGRGEHHKESIEFPGGTSGINERGTEIHRCTVEAEKFRRSDGHSKGSEGRGPQQRFREIDSGEGKKEEANRRRPMEDGFAD